MVGREPIPVVCEIKRVPPRAKRIVTEAEKARWMRSEETSKSWNQNS